MTAITFIEQRAIEDRRDPPGMIISSIWHFSATVAALTSNFATVAKVSNIIYDHSWQIPRSSTARCSRNVMAVMCWHHHAGPAGVGILTAGVG